MDSEKKNELEKQQETIGKSLALVFIPIFIIIISILLVRNNSIDYLQKEYNKIRKKSYSGKITSLLWEKDRGRTRRILIDNKWEKEIPFYIHEQLSIGDSLYKKSESDFEYYVLNSTDDTIKRDLNKFLRKKYFDKLNEK